MTFVPIIGITSHSRNSAGEVVLPGTYIDAVQSAGGNPILLPPTQTDPESLLNVLDGLILSGGGDIHPIHYNGEDHPTVYGIDEERDIFEITLAKLALIKEIPVLGICRGMQVLTVASGGNLIQHVPEVYGNAIDHRLDNPRRPIPHDVEILPESRLAQLLDNTHLNIVSWHHQAVREFSSDWKLAARSSDGVIEAIEHQTHPWAIALQWHPEMSIENPAHQRFFRSFIAACQA
ncbi:gamma-glutamyl-gamma-aminobutyrate hydrolase family protein [Leptolyngbya sp. AN03gr2]|uniref:gamma-glutamyl-gamma-aminobutyrate hydrolase family protein n=1 Tax=unclassified Leptolyngbya TaxID=2650499 RepID=UPI003D31F535